MRHSTRKEDASLERTSDFMRVLIFGSFCISHQLYRQKRVGKSAIRFRRQNKAGSPKYLFYWLKIFSFPQ